jgi:hypothetical protein
MDEWIDISVLSDRAQREAEKLGELTDGKVFARPKGPSHELTTIPQMSNKDISDQIEYNLLLAGWRPINFTA